VTGSRWACFPTPTHRPASEEQWIKLDLEYIDRWSLLLDATILLHTIPAVFRGRGAA
jgi:lipopolysaccharide/colanic/teichoic acid biosynthesis glycosyltransferase